MKKRAKTQNKLNLPFEEPASMPAPSTVLPNCTSANQHNIFHRLSSATAQIESIIPSIDSTDDILSRLKQIAGNGVMPIPTDLPKFEILPKIGIEFDSISHIEAPQQNNDPIAQLENLEKIEEPEVISYKDALEIMNYDKPLGFGIFRAFKYAATHGLLPEHKGDDEQILEYRDREGNLMDTRTAFKMQSHIFSGRDSKIKNRLRAQRRSRAYTNRENFEVGDTPLKTATALRSALAENKTAFIELTGENQRIIPYQPQQSQLDEALKAKNDRRKKRLKLKNKKREAKEAEKERLKEMMENE